MHPVLILCAQDPLPEGGSDDMLELIDDDPSDDETVAAGEAWNVLIVDDDPSVHAATALAVSRLRHRGRPVRLISAYSAREARGLLREAEDIALALIDVVMETEHAGLELVRFIRDDLDNRRIRLVVRTGQAGTYREEVVRRDYPVDDFCQKTDLTAGRLRDILVAQLDEY